MSVSNNTTQLQEILNMVGELTDANDLIAAHNVAEDAHSNLFSAHNSDDSAHSNIISNHNSDDNAHSELFAEKADAPTQIISESGDASFTVSNNCEYLFPSVGVLNMVGSKAKAHGFIYFSWEVMEVTVSVTGFTASAGDDITGAKYGELWEFSCDNGFIIWKNWGEQDYESV